MLKSTFFNYKIEIKITATAEIKNELKYSPMSKGETCIAEPNLQSFTKYLRLTLVFM